MEVAPSYLIFRMVQPEIEESQSNSASTRDFEKARAMPPDGVT